MENAHSIKSFFFGFASYHVSDGDGDEVTLHVNYAENSFRIEGLTDTVNEQFRDELKGFANSLLQRKHNTNFAKK